MWSNLVPGMLERLEPGRVDKIRHRETVDLEGVFLHGVADLIGILGISVLVGPEVGHGVEHHLEQLVRGRDADGLPVQRLDEDLRDRLAAMRQLMAPEQPLMRGVVEIDELPIGRLRLLRDVKVDRIAPHRQEMLVVTLLERRGELAHFAAADRLLRVVDAGNPDWPQRPAEQRTSRLLHGHHRVKGKLKSGHPNTARRTRQGCIPPPRLSA